MRWTKKYKKGSQPKDGDIRVVLRFLFLPKEISGIVRWLCFAEILQRYSYAEIKYHRVNGMIGPHTTGGYFYWCNESWVD